MALQEEATIIDGPLDSHYDISHLTEEIKVKRIEQYVNYFRKCGHLQTAAGQKLDFDLDTDANCLDWVYDGNVSVATKACDLCLEINACRPKDTPPFLCIVRARPHSKRSDGTGVCALCRHVRRHQSTSQKCRARGGKDPASLSVVSKKSSIDSGNVVAKRARISGSRDGNEDDSIFGSDLSDENDFCEDDEIEDSPRSYHKKVIEEENAERLQNWNSHTFVDKSLSQHAQRQHRHSETGNSKTSTALPLRSTQSHTANAGPSIAQVDTIHSRHSLPSSSTSFRDARVLTTARRDSDQESIDVPLSQLINKGKMDRRVQDSMTHRNGVPAVNGDRAALSSTYICSEQ